MKAQVDPKFQTTRYSTISEATTCCYTVCTLLQNLGHVTTKTYRMEKVTVFLHPATKPSKINALEMKEKQKQSNKNATF